MNITFIVAATFIAGALSTAGQSVTAQNVAPDAFVLRDFLGRAWRNECVGFSLNRAQFKHARAGHALMDKEGKAVPYQWNGDPRAPLVFLTDLEPFETRVYRFADGPKNDTTDLTVEETADAIRIGNRLTGVTIRRAVRDGAGFFGGIRLASGSWAGDSLMAGSAAVTATAARVTARGPVYAEVACTAFVTGGGRWDLRFRLQANEPAVLVDELAEVDAPDAAFVVTLNRGFAADRILYRRGFQEAGKPTGQLETASLAVADAQPPFVLEPWLHWQSRVRQGNWFALYGEQAPDLLAIGALRPDLWVELERPRASQAPPQALLTRDGADLRLTFPLRHGARRWLMAVPDKATSLAVLQEKDLVRAPLPQQYVIKHGNFPLDTVKDYVFTWKGDHRNYPRLFLSRKEMQRYRAAVTNRPALEARIPGYLKNPVYAYDTDGIIQTYLATGDAALGKRLAHLAVQWLQNAVDMYLKQDSLVAVGFAPHHQSAIISSLTLADAALAGDQITPAERERVLAQAAFLGYTMARPDNWSPERGFAANPNMTTSLNGYKAALACFIPSHPAAKAWAAAAQAELRHQVNDWSDDNGGWLEAPHYAMVSYDQLLGAFVMLRNAGFGDDVFALKMRKVIEWYGKISTPPDSRLNGFRHEPPIGNSYLQEPSSEFGTVAYLWRKRDPEFAANMQWLHRQHGSYTRPGIGGWHPAFAGYRSLLLDPAIPAKPPAWRSEVFPETGAILRNRFPSERETQLLMIFGRNHLHYDCDSGSFTLYGKGRILADDFGYYGCAPAEDHNLVESLIANNSGIMRLEEHAFAEPADYLRGVNGGWTRQALFVKDANPLGPNYIALNDAFQVPAPAVWRLWCAASNVALQGNGALVEGREDVSLDVRFLQSDAAALATEVKTRRSGSGMFTNWNWGPMDSTQIGLMAKAERSRGFLAVLYPRLKTEPAPAYTPLADGRGVKVQHAAGVDYVFLSATPMTYRDADLAFEGTAGAVLARGAKPQLFLGSGGKLAFRGISMASDRYLPQRGRNLLEGGDFEAGQQHLFPADRADSKIAVYAGNPASAGTHAGRYCLAVTTTNASGFLAGPGRLYVDKSQTYRVSVAYFTTSAVTVTVGGYAADGKGGNLPDAKGGTWQWSLGLYGPTQTWQTAETTIGPTGSGAAVIWPEQMLSTMLLVWISAPRGAKLYLDDLVFEPLAAAALR